MIIINNPKKKILKRLAYIGMWGAAFGTGVAAGVNEAHGISGTLETTLETIVGYSSLPVGIAGGILLETKYDPAFSSTGHFTSIAAGELVGTAYGIIAGGIVTPVAFVVGKAVGYVAAKIL